MSAPIDPTRLKTAAQAVGTDKPQLASTLAQSSLTDSQMHLVGGFADALTLNSVNSLALDSGAQTNYSASEQDKLSGIGVQPANPKPAPQADSRSWLEKATDGVAGVLGNTGTLLLHNPVTGALMTGMNWVGNVAHLPFRLLSDAVDTGNNDEINREMTADGYDPSSAGSRLAFYFSQGENVYHDLSHIRDTYDTEGNTLSDGRTMTDLIVQMQRDPEGFQKAYLAMDPNNPDTAKLAQMQKSADWQAANEAIDAEHISPGRDIARILTFGHTQNTAFHLLSGVLDGAYDWYTDPTLILGRASKAITAMDALGRDSGILAKAVAKTPWLAAKRAGLQSMTDQAGVEALLATKKAADGTEQAVTKVGKGWQAFLNDAKALRDQHALANDGSLSAEERATAAAQRAGIYRAMQNRYGQSLMPLLDEVNGTRVIAEGRASSLTSASKDVEDAADASARARGIDGVQSDVAGGHVVDPNGKPIETLSDLREYLTSTNGLLRLSTGTAARRSIIMPGKLSLRSERLAAEDTRTARVTANKALWDYSKASQIIPTDAEADPLVQQLVHADGQTMTAVQKGDAQFDELQRSALLSVRSARAKADRLSRRFTTLIPNVTHIDLTDANSSKLVEQVGRMYLNKGDSARLASAYALGDVAARRGILKGVIEQSMHAAGLYKSEDGIEFANRFLGDIDGPAGKLQQFGFGGTSQIKDATSGTMKEVALYPDQLATKVLIPSMREMSYSAAKYAVGGYARKARLGLLAFGQGQTADKLMASVKLGWIATAAGGLRNALDEIGNFAVNGMGREVLSARAVFTKATKDMRDERLGYSRQYLDALKTGLDGEGPVSRELLNKRLGIQLGEAEKSHGDALAELKRATDAQMKRDDLPNKLRRDVEAAQQRHAMATEQDNKALQAHADAKTAGLPEDQLTPLRERAEQTADERARAKQALKEAERRAADPKKELAKLQAQHDERGILSTVDAQTKVNASRAELKRAQGLATAIQHRIPYAFRRVADTMNDVLIGSALGKAMSVFGKDYAVTEERVRIAQELVDHELTQTLREGVFQSHYADEGALIGSDEYAMGLHRAGLRARKYAFQSIYKGWGEIEADGGTGLDAMAKTLQLRFADRKSPAHSWLQTVLPMIKHDAETGKTAMDRGEWDDMLKAATASVRSRLDDEDLRHFLDHAQMFKQLPDGTPVGSNANLLSQAKDEYAQRVSADLVHALGARGGGDVPHINRGLLEQIFDGFHTGLGPPDRSWLANNLPLEERPATAIGQLWGPYNPVHEPGTFPQGYTQMMTKAYGKLVTDQINALSRNPLMTALYMNARENTRGYVQHLTDAGFGEDAANEIGKRVALRQAQDEAFKHIDNPYVASQFSLINRNFATFVRAQEDWLRRWGRTVKDNPTMVRKAQLLVHGAESAGLVEEDDQHNLQFIYPGSGLMLHLFAKAFGVAGMEDQTKVPVSGELSSQLMFLNPSLDNPVGLTATPLISLPFKALTSMLGGDHELLKSSMDTLVNGQLGAGREWWEQLLPSWANRIVGGVLSSDPGSSYGQAATQALANMEAAGVLDDPALQTPRGKARFMQQWQTATRSAMVANVLFGGFAPAAPKVELGTGNGDGALRIADSTGKGTTPDYSAHIEGLHSLRDEYRQAVAQLGLDKANAWWEKTHPGELIYTNEARTQVDTHSAQAPATVRAATWMEQNSQFIHVGPGGYGGPDGVAAYFIPQGQAGTTDGTYSDIAYRAQLEAGIRTYKSLDTYFDQIVLSRGMKSYFDAKDQYDQQRSELVNSGNRSMVSQLDQQWAMQKAEIEQSNPLLAEKLAAGAENNAARDSQIGQLYALAQDNSPSTVKALGANREGVIALLQAYADYQQGATELASRSSNAATKQRQLLRSTYDARIQALAGGTGAQFPELADLARGVFRLPN